MKYQNSRTDDLRVHSKVKVPDKITEGLQNYRITE